LSSEAPVLIVLVVYKA